MKVSEIKFEPLATEEEIKLGKNFLETKRKYFGGTANFAVIGGENVSDYSNSACHGGIGGCAMKSGYRSVIATENGRTRRGMLQRLFSSKRAVFEPFLTWLVNDSYMGRFILDKDLDYCLDVGFIVSADVATPMMQNVLIATRHFYEVSVQSFQKFNELLNDGVPPTIAYPFCFNSNFSTGADKSHIVQSKTGHRAHPLFSLEAFRNFINGELGTATTLKFDEDREHYRHSLPYVGGAKFFFEKDKMDDFYKFDVSKNTIVNELIEKNEELRYVLADFRKDPSLTVYRPPNPFAKKIPGVLDPRDCTWKELWECVLPFIVGKGLLDKAEALQEAA